VIHTHTHTGGTDLRSRRKKEVIGKESQNMTFILAHPVTHSWKIKDKVKILHILMFAFLDSRRKMLASIPRNESAHII